MAVQHALKIYEEGVLAEAPGEGGYPAELNGIAAGLQRQNTTCQNSDKQKNPPKVGLVNPTCDNISNGLIALEQNIIDVYTNQPFPYLLKGNDYELSFIQHYYDGMDPLSKKSVKDGLNSTTGSLYLGF